MTIARFKTLYRGSREEQLAYLFHLADRSALLASFQADLAHYRSLTQIGAQDLLAPFLAVTQDLRLLIALVQTVQDELAAD